MLALAGFDAAVFVSPFGGRGGWRWCFAFVVSRFYSGGGGCRAFVFLSCGCFGQDWCHLAAVAKAARHRAPVDEGKVEHLGLVALKLAVADLGRVSRAPRVVEVVEQLGARTARAAAKYLEALKVDALAERVGSEREVERHVAHEHELHARRTRQRGGQRAIRRAKLARDPRAQGRVVA